MTKIDGIELLPCPFCGGENQVIDRNGTGVWVMCINTDCLAEGPFDLGQSGAIEKWNERTKQEI